MRRFAATPARACRAGNFNADMEWAGAPCKLHWASAWPAQRAPYPSRASKLDPFKPNAEAHAKKLKADLAERDSRIADLVGQLYDPQGVHLVDENARLRGLLAVANQNLTNAHIEVQKLTRSLDGARANVKRERQRNVTQLFSTEHPDQH